MYVGKPAFGIAVSGTSVYLAISSKTLIIGAGPTLQFAPMDATPRLVSSETTSLGVSPSKVVASCVKVSKAMMGISVTLFADAIASSISLMPVNVSSIRRSIPELDRACICSRNASRIWLFEIVPTGIRVLPDGPTVPAIHMCWPVIRRASLAISTALLLISKTSFSRPCCRKRNRLAPKVLVSIISAPALI